MAESTSEAPAIRETPVEELISLSLAVQRENREAISTDLTPEIVAPGPEPITADR